MNARFHPADPDGVVHDAIQTEAWKGLMHWLAGQHWAHAAFTAETGMVRPVEPTALGRLIDGDCGYDALGHYMADFVRWATRDQWGENEITPGIRAVLAKLPVRQ